MHLLLAAALVPFALAIVLARGEPAKTISCLGVMGVACVIACAALVRMLRARPQDRSAL